ncbi:hypothetical protein ES288_D06G098800v1 [Gossypium darwinii]|uniref:Uncharacterized protein n=1 Tax=Gossypium darwinii TaxID=34276 RepID=A0A5D2C403_GOSDA|nr:hypothetical protein ES288_D06G098800v1 [Gossypium darwinii]
MVSQLYIHMTYIVTIYYVLLSSLLYIHVMSCAASAIGRTLCVLAGASLFDKAMSRVM